MQPELILNTGAMTADKLQHRCILKRYFDARLIDE
jgi:hypothetical protein